MIKTEKNFNKNKEPFVKKNATIIFFFISVQTWLKVKSYVLKEIFYKKILIKNFNLKAQVICIRG